ncbi:MAG: CoA transferase [Candidatus Binataceae bacterium]|nr:CoA transferase [Candidatus Binataceae bacterium]
MMTTPRHVLDGYTVLDITQYIAGPTATRMMAEMGAEIIKVEIATAGDRTHELPLHKNGRSGYYVQQNRGKKSICIDVKQPAGLKLLRELVAKADVFVENFAPGVVARMGLDYAAVKLLNPNIIMCSISTFGQSGPLAHLPGYDFIAQAYSGITSMIGEKDGQAYFPTAALGDVGTGINGALAIVAALLHREKTGVGQYLDIALLDSYFYCHHTAVQMYSLSDGRIKPTRSGRHLPYGAPCSIYRGHDHYIIIIGGVEHQWLQLCNAMNRPDLAEDPRFHTGAARVDNMDALFDIIQGWLLSLPSDDAIMARLNEFRVPSAPVLSVEEAINHPHMRQRGTVTRVHDRLLGDVDLPGFPLRFSAFPQNLELEAPLLGEHNGEILSRVLDYTPEQIHELEHSGVLFSKRV